MSGKLIYVMGSSGSGKDTLLDYVRKHFSPSIKLIQAHRYITRSHQSVGENHIELSSQEFDLRKANNLFAMHWESHNKKYGIGIEIEQWMQEGVNVILNGSRAYFPKAAAKYSSIIPILIKVSPEVLYERLITRGREPEEEIKKRVARANQFNIEVASLIVIQNDSSVEESGKAIIKAIMNALQ